MASEATPMENNSQPALVTRKEAKWRSEIAQGIVDIENSEDSVIKPLSSSNEVISRETLSGTTEEIVVETSEETFNSPGKHVFRYTPMEGKSQDFSFGIVEKDELNYRGDANYYHFVIRNGRVYRESLYDYVLVHKDDQYWDDDFQKLYYMPVYNLVLDIKEGQDAPATLLLYGGNGMKQMYSKTHTGVYTAAGLGWRVVAKDGNKDILKNRIEYLGKVRYGVPSLNYLVKEYMTYTFPDAVSSQQNTNTLEQLPKTLQNYVCDKTEFLK